MKLVKMSLAAAMLMGASAYAEIKNVELDGYAKIWYQTTDASNNANDGLFDQVGARGDASVNVGATADISTGMKGTVRVQALDTLGLESDVVSARTTNAHSDLTTKTWVSDANIAYTVGKTTMVVGRQQIDTPLLFTEKWNAAYNTFDAAVVVNSDIPNTTLVGAYVGKHNGTELSHAAVTTTPYGTVNGSFETAGSLTDSTTNHSAYGLGAVWSNDMVTAQGWYYDLNSLLSAVWVDATVKVAGFDIVAQYGTIDPASQYTAALADSELMAVKVGYTMNNFNVYAAYSTTDDSATKGALSVCNIATGDKSKVPTGSVFTDGRVVGSEGVDAWKVGGSVKLNGVKLAASIAEAEVGANNDEMAQQDIQEIDLIASANVGPVNLKAIYLNQDVDLRTGTDYDTDAVRLIVTLPF